MSSKESLEELTHSEYWDKRYEETAATEEKYDWLRNFEAIKPFLIKYLPPATKDPSLLQLGCGNSTLTQDVFLLGYKNQVSIDFSPVVIEQMKSRHPDLEWRVMDVRKMELPDATFDVAIDKATLDAMLYGSLWDPIDSVKTNIRAYADEVARILKPGGLWLYITWRQPHFIKPLLSRSEIWSLESETLADGGGMFEYYGYVMKKFAVEDLALDQGSE